MKIQTLGIIFIIIILPISFALSLYTKAQLETLSLQSLYDAKLQQSTYDALQAFQINIQNNTESNLADSKIKDIEASIKAFFNSLEGNFELRGYSLNELKEYVPAIVYTMYDGYYIYSPYNNIATTTEEGVVINQSEPDNIQYGLKPYIYYSCRYKRAGDDFVITYSLDNYITIKGIIDGKYVNDSGYLISNIEPYGNGLYKYNGIVIESEGALEEYIGNTKYQYVKISGTKYYWDQSKSRIFYMLNGNMHEQVSESSNAVLYNKYVNLIMNNSSALRYYKEAYEFTNRILNTYNLKNLQITDAYDAEGNRIEFATNANKNIFTQDDIKDKTPIEYTTSNFNQHKKAVIRYAIESNLSMAIANFNRYTKNTSYDYQMPVLNEVDWDMLASNISIVSFLQGLNLGAKIYNGYSLVLNTETEELVREQDIYIVGNDGHYHRAEDKYLLEYKTLGDYIDKSSYSKGVLDLDFRMTSANGSGNNKIYYYPRRELSCYDCVVNHMGINYDFEYDNIYEYLNKLNVNTQTTLLKKVYYTALGRERWGRKLNAININDIDNKVDEEFDTGEINIEFNPKTYTNQTVKASIKFSDSINLDKVVIAISTPPVLSSIESQTLLRFENGDFTDITSNIMEYDITENSIVYVVAYSKSGKKIIKYDIVDWIDANPPQIDSVIIEEILDNEIVVKRYNSIQEFNNKGYQWTKNTVRQIITALDEGSGVDRIEYTYDNGATYNVLPESYGGIWNINYTFNEQIRIRAVDKAGNYSEWTAPYRISVDKTPPTKVEVTLKYSNENGAIYTGALTNRNIYQSFASSELHSGIARWEYSINNGSTVGGTFTNNSIISTSIFQRYMVRAVDNVGNVGEWSEPYIINIDKNPPLTGEVQNKNQIKLNINNLVDITRIDIKYKEKYLAGEYKNITITGGITPQYQYLIQGLQYSTEYEIFMVLYDDVGNTVETNHIILTTEISHIHTDSCYHQHNSSCYQYQVWETFCANCHEGPLAHYEGNPYGACNNFKAWEGNVLTCTISTTTLMCGFP